MKRGTNTQGTHRVNLVGSTADNELINLIAASGQTPSATSTTQVQQAVLNQCIYENDYIFHENEQVFSFD